MIPVPQKNVVEITLENFQKTVMEGSQNKLVLIAFWAEQIPESVELKNTLTEKLALFNDVISFATVDCQTQQEIAQQFGLQGLPTAVLVKEGQPIDGLTGPQTEQSIAEFLVKYLPKEEDTLLAQAKVYLGEQNISQALITATQAYKIDNQRADIKFVLVDLYILLGKIEEAEILLSTITMVDQNGDYQALMAKLELASHAANSPEIQALEASLEQDIDNRELQRQLATQYHQVNRNEEALTLLFRLVQSDNSDTESKPLLLDILKALPEGDPLATKYRRKLYTLLY
jgi:putative thioredoxin